MSESRIDLNQDAQRLDLDFPDAAQMDATKDRQALLEAVALFPKESMEGKSFVDIYKARRFNNTSLPVTDVNQHLQNDRIHTVDSVLQNLPADTTPEDLYNLGQGVANYIDVQYESDAEAAIAENSYADAEVTSTAQAELPLWQALSEGIDKQDWWDWSKNVAGLIFIPDIELSKEEVLEQMNWETEEDRVLFANQASLRLGEMYDNMTIEQRVQFLPALQGAIKEATDNPLKQGILLDHFLNPNKYADTFDKVTEAFDWASYLVGVGKIAKLGMVKALTKVKGTRAAAKVVAAAADDPKVAKAAGLSQDAIEASKRPLAQLHDMTPGAADVSADVAIDNALELKRMEDSEALLRTVKDYKIEVPFLRPADEAEATNKVLKGDALEDLLSGYKLEDDFSVTNVRLAPETADGDILVTASRKPIPGTEGPEQVIEEAFYFSKNAVGEYKARPFNQSAVSSFLERGLTSPEQIMKQMIDPIVMADLDLAKQGGLRIQNEIFKPLYQRVWGKASKKTKTALSQILTKGDEMGVKFTPAELKNGITTADGTFYLNTAAEQDRYFAARRLADELYYLTNFTDRVQKARDGWKGFNVLQVTKDGDRVLTPFQGKPLRVQDVTQDVVYLASDARSVQRGSDEFNELIKTHELFRTQSPVMQSGNAVEVVLVPKTGIKALPYETVEYIPGYMPRSYTSENKFIRMANVKSINGVRIQELDQAKIGQIPNGYRNVGRALTQADAEKWLNSPEGLDAIRTNFLDLGMSPEEVEKIIKNGPGKYFFIDTDKSIPGGADFLISDMSRRRSEGTILNLSKNNRLPVHEAMARQVSAVTDKFSTADLVDGLEAKWHKTYGKYLVDPSRPYNTNSNPLNKKKMGVLQYNNALQHQSVFTNIRHAPLAGQDLIHAEAIKVADAIGELGGVSKETKAGLAESFLKMGRQHPADKGKAVSFQLFFGAMNPRQALVQFSQAAVGAGLNPDLAPKVVKQAGMLNTALTKLDGVALVDDIADQGRLLGVLDNAMSGDDFKHMINAYKKTGLDESVELAGEWGRIQDGAAISMNAVKQSLDKGFWMYRFGEKGQKRVNWLFAANRYMKDNPNVSWKDIATDDRIARNVHALAEKYTLSMSTPNKAAYQRGYASLMTQYKSHTGRVAEAYGLLPGSGGIQKTASGWSHGERLTLLGSQAVLYGPYKVAFGSSLVALGVGTYEHMTGEEVEAVDLPDGTRILMNGGVTSYLGNMLLGVDLDFSSSMSILSGMRDMRSVMLDNEQTISELALGPLYGAALQRFWPAFKESTWHIWDMSDSYEAGKYELSAEDMWDVIKPFFGMWSTFSQLEKAKYLRATNQYVNRYNKGIGVSEDRDQLEVLGITAESFFVGAFNIPSLEVSNKYDRIKFEKDDAAKIKENTDIAVKVFKNRLLDYNNLKSPKERKIALQKMQRALHFFVTSTFEDEGMQVKLHRSIRNALEKTPEMDKFIQATDAGVSVKFKQPEQTYKD